VIAMVAPTATRTPANVERTGISSKEMADFRLEEAGVAGLNGGAFGDSGDGYIRFSYANSLENLMEAVARIEKVAVGGRLWPPQEVERCRPSCYAKI
jgi:aspartate/methionine/tyrosine aminotransferase